MESSPINKPHPPHGGGPGATQYTPVQPSYGYQSKIKSFWRSILFRHSFEDSALEKLYGIFVYKLQLSSLKGLVIIGIVLTTLVSVLNFVFSSGNTLENICIMILCVLFVCMLIFLHTKYMKASRLYIICIIVLVLFISLTVISLPINFSKRLYKHYTPADGLWPTLLVIFLFYTLMPLRIYITMPTGLLLSIAHTLVAIFLTETYEWLLWRQITANILLHVFVHCIGVFVADKTEHAQRKVFSESRGCIAARIEAEEENEKLERLLCSVLPQSTAKELKTDMLAVDNEQPIKPYIQSVDNVSLLYANIIGLTELSSQCTASELVTILNDVFAKLDNIATENHCSRYRILGDVYFCTCGLPDARPDHAKCCVDLAIEIIDMLREIREGTELELYTKIGIHTGNVTCGIVGNQRWCFEVFGHDVQLGKEVMLACLPGKVLISKPTFEYLQGEYDVEPANVWNRSEYLRDRKTETFYVIPSPQRPPIGLFPRNNIDSRQMNQNRHSYRNMSGVISKLQEGLMYGAELPFLPIVQGPELEKLEKEHLTNPYQSSRSVNSLQLDRVQRYLTQSVMSRAIEKNKSDWVNILTLRYHHGYKEKRYHKQEDTSFSTTMLCSMVLLVLIAAVQAIVLPRTLLLLCLFLLCFTWIAIVLIIFLAAKLRCVDCELQKSLAVRLTLMIITILFLFIVGQLNVLCCRGGLIFPHNNATINGILAFNRDYHLSCDMPHYISLSGVMAVMVVIIFIKMVAMVKMIMLLVIVIGYVLVLEWTHRKLFDIQDLKTHPDFASHLQGLLALLLFAVSVYIQGRLIEWVLRLGFLWKDQAMEERIAVTEFQNHVRQLVINMLPSHVATHFVDFTGLKHSLVQYSHSYPRVGVCCTSIPNFLDHFRGNITLGNMNHNNNNNGHMQGVDAFKVLNELITTFDEFLSEDRFRDLEKIRSFGHGYQVTVGLVPERPILDTTDSLTHHLTQLIEFIYTMRDRIVIFNQEKGTDFKLRSGVTLGPISVGVIGARRPLFDMWGYTMYLANLMEASGKPDYIQVTEDVLQPLTTRYEFQPRGPLYLNGRGELATYFITGRKIVNMPTQGPFGANLPYKRTPENWKRLSHEVSLTAGIKSSMSERTSHDAMMRSVTTERIYNNVNGSNVPLLGSHSGGLGSHSGGLGSHGSNTNRSFESYHSLQNNNYPADKKDLSQGESPRSQRSFTNMQRQNSNDSTGQMSAYGIRIQGIQQRSRIPSDESATLAGKSTMTPPSSLSRKRKDSSGTISSISRTNSGAGLLAPPPDPNHNRMASPDLPMVHYQRGPGNNNTQQEVPFTKNTLTQSQILNPEGGDDISIATTHNLQESPHSNSSNNVLVTPRRSSTQTPSSNRSSAETVGSVISVHVLDSPNHTLTNGEVPYNNTPPRNKTVASPHGNSSFVGNLPKIEESNRESRSFSSKDSLDNLENKSRSSRVSLGSHDFEATGSEIAEMDNILRELGCGAGGNQQRGNPLVHSQSAINCNTQLSSQTNGALNNLSVSSPVKHKHNRQKANIVSARDSSPSDDNSSKTKTMSSDHGTQISEYENDDLVQAGPISSVEVRNAPKISLLHKHNSLPDNLSFTKDNSCQTKPLNKDGGPKDYNDISQSQSISTQTNLSSTTGVGQPTKIRKDHMYRPLYNKRLMTSLNDDSSSTSSSIYGIPKMHRVKVGEPEEDSPPPLPPPPSEEAMMSLERRMNQVAGRQGNYHKPPPPSNSIHQPSSTSIHHHHMHHHIPPHYRQPLFGNSAFRPVAPTPRTQYHPVAFAPVIKGPNLGFVGVGGGRVRPVGIRPPSSGLYHLPTRQHMRQYGPPSSNTSEENASIMLPRRKPTKQQQTSANQTQSHDHNKQNKTKATVAMEKPPSSETKNSKMPSKTRHHSEGNNLDESTDDTLENNDGEKSGSTGRKQPRPSNPPFQIKRRQPHSQPIRKCRSLDYIPSDIEDSVSVTSRAESPSCEYTTNSTNKAYMPITELIKSHIIGDNISLSSLESGSEMSRSEPDLNYDSSTTAYESEYDNYRPGMASDEDYFVPEPVSDVELGMFDDIDLEDVTVSDQYNIDMVDLMNKKVMTDV